MNIAPVLVFLLSTLLYILAGYPLSPLLAMLSRPCAEKAEGFQACNLCEEHVIL